MVKCCVFFAVRTEFLNIIWAIFDFKRWKYKCDQSERDLPSYVIDLVDKLFFQSV
jgi:hypothetical protein